MRIGIIVISIILLAGTLASVIAWAAVDDDGGDNGASIQDVVVQDAPESDASPGQPSPTGNATIEARLPTAIVEVQTAAAARTPLVPPTVVARAIPTSPPLPASPAMTITLERFDCDGYRFAVASQPAALEKVHWTATSPADPGPSSSRSVADAEVSQSPGTHAFTHEQPDWTQPGSNRLRITAWDVDGSERELTRDIDC
jgi:hypothetical protein